MKKSAFLIFCYLLTFFVKGQGNFVWAARMGAAVNDDGYSITVDASGNVYTTGGFSGTVDFDPGLGVFNLVSAGSIDVFVSKFDAAGNFVWAKNMGGTSIDIGNSIAVDASGNVYTTGQFQTTADFDPGAGVSNLVSAAGYDIFVSKLDVNGNFVWAKRMGGPSGGGDYGYGIAIDGAGNVYTTGIFNGTSDFDPGVGTYNMIAAPAGLSNVFVSKLDASGIFVWAQNMGGTGADAGYSIAVDASGYVYTTGAFVGTADFDPGFGVSNLISAGGIDIFISKLDPLGAFVWAKSMGAAGSDIGYSIAVDVLGNVYSTGFFNGTADFDPSAGIYNLTSAGLDDVFISKLNSSGNLVFAEGFGGTGSDYGYGIAINSIGEIYTTGFFTGTVDFDPTGGVYNLTSAGNTDIFVNKLDALGTFVWTSNMGGAASDKGRAIALDGSCNVYTAGWFNGTADFDPLAAVSNLVSAGFDDIFVSKLLDANCAATLPIELISFEAKCKGSAIQLNWSTASETGNDYFSVERSNDAVNFESITKINGAGNSNSKLNYSFNETNLTGRNQDVFYFRLKQTDFNGKSKYSNTVFVSNCKEETVSVNIYPNPTTSTVILSVSDPDSYRDASIEMYNSLGTVIFTAQLENGKAEIDLSQQANGIYFVKIGSVTKKIIKE